MKIYNTATNICLHHLQPFTNSIRKFRESIHKLFHRAMLKIHSDLVIITGRIV